MTNNPSNNPGYQTKDAAPSPQRHKVTCAICGKKRFYPSDNVLRMDQPTKFVRVPWMAHLPPDRLRPENIITVPVGGFVCWYHAALKEESDGTV